MNYKRRIISLTMLSAFIGLASSGLLSYFTEYSRSIATAHTFFGGLFIIIGLAHIFNNIKPLSNYLKRGVFLLFILGTALLGYLAIIEAAPLKKVMDFGARSKAKLGTNVNNNYSVIEMNLDHENLLHLDVKKASHFWHPQIAIWSEDTLGNYLETLFVTRATAKGIFAGGRSKENFKTLDTKAEPISKNNYRRVNALPIWSYKRGVKYADGLYAPSSEQPLPDAISGATPLDNFILKTSVNYTSSFILKFEINVAFDDNEYYSAYDFPDDETFHNGTGQLGQPSLIFECVINPKDNVTHKLMSLQGHGHHSAQNGLIYTDLDQLTTALEIIEFIVVAFIKDKA